MKQFASLIVVMVAVAIFLTGCGTEDKGAVARVGFEKFLALNYEDVGDRGKANLSIAHSQNKAELEERINYYSLQFIPGTEIWLYIDEDETLYAKKPGAGPV